MAYTKYSLTPANNNATPPDGAPEGMLPSAVNDTMRDMMAQIRDCGDGIRDGTYTMTAPKITGGTITGAAFTGNTFTSPVISGGSINNTPIGGTTANSGAFTTLSASGVATISAGTVSAPALTTTGDTNTGIFFPAADTIAFTEGGVEAMRIDSSGNVGIGTTSPTSAKLVVNGGIKAIGGSAFDGTNGYSFGGSGDTDGGMFSPADGILTFATNNAERMRIDSSGNVGIGTTTMTGRFNVGGSTNPNIYSVSTGGITTVFSSTDAFGGGIVGTVSNHPQIFYTNNTERLRINAAGDVGIGTATPSSRLTVLTPANGGLLVTDGTQNGIMYASSLGGIVAGTTSNHPYIFFSNNTERMRIKDDGAVLIGTTTSLATLTVNGNISPVQAPSSNWGIDFTPSSSSGTYVTIANDATYDIAYGSGYVFIYEDAGNGVAEIACYYGVTNIRFQSATLYNVAENNAGTLNVFYKASVARYRIQNKTGSSKVIWISTLRFRNAV